MSSYTETSERLWGYNRNSWNGITKILKVTEGCNFFVKGILKLLIKKEI